MVARSAQAICSDKHIWEAALEGRWTKVTRPTGSPLERFTSIAMPSKASKDNLGNSMASGLHLCYFLVGNSLGWRSCIQARAHWGTRCPSNQQGPPAPPAPPPPPSPPSPPSLLSTARQQVSYGWSGSHQQKTHHTHTAPRCAGTLNVTS